MFWILIKNCLPGDCILALHISSFRWQFNLQNVTYIYLFIFFGKLEEINLEREKKKRSIGMVCWKQAFEHLREFHKLDGSGRGIFQFALIYHHTAFLSSTKINPKSCLAGGDCRFQAHKKKKKDKNHFANDCTEGQ